MQGMSDISDMPKATSSARPTSASRRERNLAEVRERATDLAERIVLEQGGSALNARGLAEHLGISVGTLYNAFGDLDGVVRAVNARCGDRLAASLEAAANGAPSDPRAQLVAIGEAYMDFALSEPRRWWMLFERDVDTAPDARSQELQEQLLRMLVTAGGGAPDKPAHRQFFLLLWASVHGLVSLAVRPAITSIDPEAARQYIGYLVDAGLRSFPAGRGRTVPAE